MGTVIVAGVLVVIVASVTVKLVRNKKSGKSCCDGNCAHCSACRH